MADERYFAGNTLSAFTRTDAATVDGDTTSGRFDSNFVSSCIKITNPLAFIESKPFVDAASATTFQFACEVYLGASSGIPLANLFEFVNSSGVVIARIRPISSVSSTYQFSYWNGSAFVDLGATFVLGPAVRLRVGAKLVCGVSGTIEIFVGGARIAFDLTSGMNAAVTNVAKLRIFNNTNSNVLFVSQAFGANFDVRDSRWKPLPINALSAVNTAGAGAYTDVNETVLDESTAFALTSSGQKRGVTSSGLTIPSGYQAQAYWLNGRGRVSGAGPSDGKFGVRSVGTNYTHASALALNGGYEPRGRYWLTDPATSAAWTQSGVNAAEPYVEAA